MGIVKWFKENVLKIKPIFKVKIVKTWFSDKWYNIKFSNDNGWTWYYIIEEGTDYCSPYYALKAREKDFRFDTVESWAKQFDTYKKCRENNDNVYKRIKEINAEKRKNYEEKLQKAENAITKFNTKHE